MRITRVKKIKADGSPCRKCADVLERLEKDGLMARIDRVVVADERDPASEGMVLAAQHGVEAAPFFIVEREGSPPAVYISFFKFVKEVLGEKPRDEAAEAKELLDQNPDLDFI